MKKLAMILAVLVLTITLTGCGSKEKDGEMIDLPETTERKSTEEVEELLANTEKVNVVIEVENYGEVALELYPEIAPITVENFIKLVNEGFYDGLTFHRIIDGFMIQGGDPSGDGTGGSEETIVGEFPNNGVENPISHVRGVLSMARSGADMNSASSQFFIVQSDSTFLDGDYAAFGRVTSGLEIVDSICQAVPVQDDNGTVNAEDQPKILSIKVIE